MSGAVEALRHLELMALNTAQTAAAASKVNEYVALLTAALTTPPARSYADGVAIEALESIADFAEVRLKDGHDMGARIWRIALEDIVRDARAALSQGGKADV